MAKVYYNVISVLNSISSVLLAGRWVISIAVSIFLHLAFFMLLIPVDFFQKELGRGVLQVNLLSSSQILQPDKLVSPLHNSDSIYAKEHSDSVKAGNKGSGLSLGARDKNRYFLYYEVDKRADLIYSAPIEHLDLINSADAVGRIKVRVFVNEAGIVDSAIVLDAAPPGIYNGVALDALMHSRFSPAIKEGVAVKSQKVLEIKFGTQR